MCKGNDKQQSRRRNVNSTCAAERSTCHSGLLAFFGTLPREWESPLLLVRRYRCIRAYQKHIFSFRPKEYLYLEYRLCLSGCWLWLFLKRILFVTHNIRGGYCIDVKMAFAYDERIEVGSYELASYTSQRLPQSIVSVLYMFFLYIQYTCILKPSWLAKNRQKMYLCLCLDIKAPLPLLLPNA